MLRAKYNCFAKITTDSYASKIFPQSLHLQNKKPGIHLIYKLKPTINSYMVDYKRPTSCINNNQEAFVR